MLPQYASNIPAGALCSNYENSWSQPGVDGCADNPRATADNDNKLNPYYSATYGLGLLLDESSRSTTRWGSC